MKSGDICSEDEEVNHQSYWFDLNTSQGNIISEEVGAFQRDILQEELEFNNQKIFGKRYGNRNSIFNCLWKQYLEQKLLILMIY